MQTISCIIFLGLFYSCFGAKILTLVPTQAKSHYHLFERLSIELANRGHKVTLLASFKTANPTPNLKEITLSISYERFAALFGNSNLFELRHMPKWMTLFVFPQIGPKFSDMILSTDEMQNIIKSEEKFDLIIAEIFLGESFLAGLSHKLKAPLISSAIFIPNFYASYMVGNPAPASYVPASLVGLSDRMNFWERLENFIFGLTEEVIYRFKTLPDMDKVMRKYFGDDLPPIQDILRNTSLVLVNHHYSLGFPRPYLPNMVEIGGYHVPPPKPLPKDLQKYMDESKEGVILFSMGSHLKSAQLPEEKKRSILKAFSRLKQNVLWKFEDDTLMDLPKNIKISKWLPQSDILAHPNLKLFITHGGLLSTTEAVTRGVPVVGIPVFGDQPINMKYSKLAGFAIPLDFDDLNENVLYDAIQEMLTNPKYKENAKRRSALIQDTPLSSIDTAVYWIEYVIRHKGAPHLRSAAQDLAWYQLYLLDVLAFIFIVSSVLIYISFKISKFVIKKLFCRNRTKVSKNKKIN